MFSARRSAVADSAKSTSNYQDEEAEEEEELPE